MATYLLDTNHASQLLDANHPLWPKVRATLAAGHTLLLPLDVMEEMQFGVAAIHDPAFRTRRQAELDTVLAAFTTTALTLASAIESGNLRGRLRRTGRQIDTIDAHLAAIAKLEDYVLLTDDNDFAPLAGEIRIENWLR